MSDVQLENSAGLLVYRELLEREKRGRQAWAQDYGPGALQSSRSHDLLDLGKFQKAQAQHQDRTSQLSDLRARVSELRLEAVQPITPYRHTPFASQPFTGWGGVPLTTLSESIEKVHNSRLHALYDLQLKQMRQRERKRKQLADELQHNGLAAHS